MKIGAFSQKYHIPIATVRHYINLGLLVPEKKGAQYHFTGSDCNEMELILSMKSAGFKLSECGKYLSILRFYNKDDYLVYEKLMDFLNAKKQNLYQERNQINSYIKSINQKIRELKNSSVSTIKTESSDAPATAPITALSGFPLDTVNMLRCPHCHSEIKLSHVEIINNSIINGSLSCECGYHAEIENGIMHTENRILSDEDSSFLKSYFGEENLGVNEDIIALITTDDCSDQHLANLHKSGKWIHNELSQIDLSGKTILIPDISVQYLYNYHDSVNLKDCTIIITAFTERTIRAMRHHIANVNPTLKIAYIINKNGQLPLKQGCIDVIVDYMGSCNLGFFFKEHYFNIVRTCLAENAVIIGAQEYYRSKTSRSIAAIHANYPYASGKIMTEGFLLDALTDNGFKIKKYELVGEACEMGRFFEYHVPGDVCCNSVYLAARTMSE